MAQRYDSYWRLEPDPQRRSFAAGFAARVHDPLWFLARQWQMGEHQGENASTPVRVNFHSMGTALEPAPEMPELDPLTTPPEAIIEGEPDDWWTMGRRIRLGETMALRVGLTVDAPAAAAYLLVDPPPPYEALAGRFDGLALWHDRGVLDDDGSRFGDLDIPETRHAYWQSDELVYQSAFPLAGGAHALKLPRHHGTSVDWFSADATSDAGVPAFEPSGEVTQAQVYPAALQYPGAPRSRWWEIEDAAVDLGGYPPDSSHFPTTLLIDLVASHSDDWFLFPVDASVGHVLTLMPGTVIVTDAFGDEYTLSPPNNWSLFKTTGLDMTSLMVWLRAVTPLQGEPLEQVLLGCDEYSNMLWAVELRVDSREMTPPTRTPEQDVANPPLVKPTGVSEPGEQKRYAYVPGQDATAYWHPYELVEPGDDGPIARRFIQRRLADLGRVNLELMPAATAQVLRSFGPTGERVHEISPATIPTIGLKLERRAMLARDVRGNPLLWIRRQRMPFLAPPGRHMRFDLMAEDAVPRPA
ncbi:hypothetical protein K788_0001814 (plasmid) [Paraburkholderia caribensis MBA4]|uniref:DUF2169 domain-containing protein n=1 Tax=Paraburkholderia caribensis MBA4 TaxID=1323664 RepID=A0A0P0RQU9_9BURK|nr:hypothetical protein [Paraburkholderia caribensis]ALL71387.1 hypothetical protein K788_0001814 [Paraburkholderia caribensis MBA4]